MMFDWYAAINESPLGIIPYQYSVPAGQFMDDELSDKIVLASRKNISIAEIMPLVKEVNVPQTGTVEEMIARTEMEIHGAQIIDHIEKRFLNL
jgi:hypothetical protein